MQVIEAFKRVKANGGSAGVDGVSTVKVASNLRKYLYPLWNRMASGSYFPKAVRQTLIPKGDGKMRALGIPTVVDRVAQQVIATELEAIVDKKFSANSFGYRPNKSAHQALEQCRINCMNNSWVIDLDIKGFFDNIDHELLMKAVAYHTDKKHILLYCKRWLEAPVQLPNGTLKHSVGKGTPQGGVISPVLANIFLDIVFDKWMDKNYPEMPFERYADDIVVHCHTIKTALRLLEEIKKRFNDCKLELNREKSKIVYCRFNQKKQPPFKVRYQKFDFLGFTFKPRIVKARGKIRLGFTPAISQKSIARITRELFEMNFHRWVHFSINRVAELLNIRLRGILNYYTPFRKSELRKLFRIVNFRIAKWVRNKYRRFRRRPWMLAFRFLKEIAKSYPNLFVHWQHGFMP
ncbi:MAG: group II intron reverse transcriptase/maturase [Lentisphaeria bacterium]